MGLWAGIKYAINSTLGTSDFKPLDKIIRQGKSLVASDELYYTVGVPQTISEDVTMLKTAFKMHNAGSFSVEISLKFKANFYVYKNGTKLIEIIGPSNVSTEKYTKTVYFSAGDVISFGTTALSEESYISNLFIYATVKDTSMLDILEV